MRRVALLVLALGACAQPRARDASVTPGEMWTTTDWPSTLAVAQQAALEGRFADAERELATYADRVPGTPQSIETRYWRALFLLDPANPERDPSAAIGHLDRYVADPERYAAHHAEALVLRRLAATLDSVATARRLASRADSAPTTDTARTREAELVKQNQQLREQLERTNAELERIKRRLAERP